MAEELASLVMLLIHGFGADILRNMNDQKKLIRVMKMRKTSLKLIPGDGIGIEVVREGKKILKKIEKAHGGIKFAFDDSIGVANII